VPTLLFVFFESNGKEDESAGLSLGVPGVGTTLPPLGEATVLGRLAVTE
jgi:hypothetical protein